MLIGVSHSWYLLVIYHDLSYSIEYKAMAWFIAVIFHAMWLTINDLSAILDTTDTSFLQPCE